MATFDPGLITEPRTFRFRCDGTGGTVFTAPFTVTPQSECDDTPVTADARLTSTDPDGVWDTTGPDDPTEQFCLEDCGPNPSYLWQTRVAQPDPNDPQAFVSDADWQPVNFDGPAPQCFTLTAPNAATVAASSGFDPATATGLADLTQTLYFEIRGSCDGGVTWFNDTVEIPYFHTDDSELP